MSKSEMSSAVCPKCNREFGNPGAMASHARFAHPKEISPNAAIGTRSLSCDRTVAIQQVFGSVIKYVDAGTNKDLVNLVAASLPEGKDIDRLMLYLLVQACETLMMGIVVELSAINAEMEKRTSAPDKLSKASTGDLTRLQERHENSLRAMASIIKSLVATAGMEHGINGLVSKTDDLLAKTRTSVDKEPPNAEAEHLISLVKALTPAEKEELRVRTEKARGEMETKA